MPTTTRTFRVFVSSTFEDLKAERDALQRDVFPRLRKLCEENGARFQAIDLRWGVRDEAALDQQTMEICLREIERCQQTGIKPNFIVLLGERYGWRPLPARIEAGEFEKVRKRAGDADKRLIDDWYERDDNAVPPEFLLKPRTGEFADKDRWGDVELKLHRILREAARDAGLAPDLLIKYEASATHQEILKGLGQSEEDRKHVFAFFHAPAEGVELDSDLEALEEDLRHKLPAENVRPFQIGEIEKLCKDVEETLKKVILDEAIRFTWRDSMDIEKEAHDRFAEDRCRIFVGRTDALRAIADYLNGPERRPLVLHDESGSGKSAVMAVASQHYKRPGRVIRRFIGASPESASGHALLTSLCKQIAPGETPVDYYKLEKAFQERLSTGTAEQPLVLFIDALDQLSASDPARAAIWVPEELPAHVKVVVSTTDDGERLPTGLQVALEPMTVAEGLLALDALLREARRTLQLWQREVVLTHFERCGLPLYLKLAAEESRLWKSFSTPDACKLGEGIAGVLDTLFDRLASNANHGPVLVERSLGYLAAARYGLTEGEMLDVLTADVAVWDDFSAKKHHEVSERRLPVVVWSRLSLDLEPYLTERMVLGDKTTTYFHRQLAERALPRRQHHTGLANYFVSVATQNAARWRTDIPRILSEIPYQQTKGELWNDLSATFGDFEFLEATCTSGMSLELLARFDNALDVWQQSHGQERFEVDVLSHSEDQYGSALRQRGILGRLISAVRSFAMRGLKRDLRSQPRLLRLIDLRRSYVYHLSAITESPANLAQELILGLVTQCHYSAGARVLSTTAAHRMDFHGKPWIRCIAAPDTDMLAERQVSITKYDEIEFLTDQNKLLVGKPSEPVREILAAESLDRRQVYPMLFPEARTIRRSSMESGAWESGRWLMTGDDGEKLALTTPWLRATISEYGFLKLSMVSSSNTDLEFSGCSAMAISSDGGTFAAVGSTKYREPGHRYRKDAWCILLESGDVGWALTGPYGAEKVGDLRLHAERLDRLAMDDPAGTIRRSYRKLAQRLANFRSKQPGPLIALERLGQGFELQHLTGTNGPTALAFSPNGRFLIVGFEDGKVLLVRRRNSSEADVDDLLITNCEQYQTSGQIQSLASSSDDSLFYALNSLGTLMCVGRDLSQSKSKDWPTVNSVRFSANGRWHATASFDGRLEIADRRKVVKKDLVFPGGISDVAFSSDSKSIVCLGGSDVPIQIDIETGKVQKLQQWGQPTTIQLSPDGHLVALCYSPPGDCIPPEFFGLRIFDQSSGRETARCQELFPHIAFTPLGDGLFVSWLKIGGHKHNVTLFNSATLSRHKEYVLECEGDFEVVNKLSPSPCGRFLAVGLTDPARIMVVSTVDGRTVRSVALGENRLISFEFSPCGSHIGAILGNRNLRFFDFTTTEQVASLALPAEPTSIAWSPCGTMVLIGLTAGGTMIVEPRRFVQSAPIVVGLCNSLGSFTAKRTGRRAVVAICPFCSSAFTLRDISIVAAYGDPGGERPAIRNSSPLALEPMLVEESCPNCRQRLRVAIRSAGQ